MLSAFLSSGLLLQLNVIGSQIGQTLLHGLDLSSQLCILLFDESWILGNSLIFSYLLLQRLDLQRQFDIVYLISVDAFS